MYILVYGNCQCKVISDYLLEQPLLKNSIIRYFFTTHTVELLDLDFVEKIDVFIYQHVKATSLKSQYPKTNLFHFTPEGLIQKMKPSVKTISIPSIYFSALYPNSCSLAEMMPRLPYGTKIDWFFNHTFNSRVFDALEKGEPVDKITDIMLNTDLYTDKFLEDNIKRSLLNLRHREEENKVDIRITDFLERNYKTKRLTWTTNHPTKIVFNYIVQEILKLLNLPSDNTLLSRPDKLDQDIFPIFSCVRKYLCLDPNEFSPLARINCRNFIDMKKYIQFYRDTLDGKDVAKIYPQEKRSV